MIYVFGDYTLDTQRYELRHVGVLCKLEPQVFNVLAYLLEHHTRVVSKDELLEQYWPQQFVNDVNVNQRVMAARKVLGDNGRLQRYIKTVHGRGYRFVADVTLVESSLVAPSPTAAMAMVPPAPPGLATLPPRLPETFVGREAALEALQQDVLMALHGERQVVFLTGEAGIGKTTLVDALVTNLASTMQWWIGRGQCIDQYGAGEAYLPLLEALGQWCRGPEGHHLVALLRQQAPHWLLQMPAFLSPTEYDEIQRRCSGTTRDRMLRELTESLETLSTTYPLLVVLEDLHWSDTATLDWLGSVARRRMPARLVVLGTYRPAEAHRHEPSVWRVAEELQRQGHAQIRPLPTLPEAGVAAYLRQRFGDGAWATGLAEILYQRTQGHPFFFVTMIDAFVRQGYLVAHPAGWTFHGELDTVRLGVPDSVRQLIERQLEDAQPDEQAILVAASVAGAEFSAAAVAAALDQAIEPVEVGCATLARHGQFLQLQGTVEWPDGTVAGRYGFRHALYHDVLYERIPPSQRLRWHRQIGLRMEAAYGMQTRDIAAELAMHFTRGRDHTRAIHYLQHAADNALSHYANREAIHHLSAGLAILHTLPSSVTHQQHELAMLLTLSSACLALQGYAAPEVEQIYRRARTLCEQVGTPQQLYKILLGLWHCHFVRGEPQTACALGAQLLAEAQRQPDVVLQVAGHFAFGVSLAFVGELVTACEHLTQAVALSTPTQHQQSLALIGVDLGVFCRAWLSHVLWLLGVPAQALAMNQAAQALAQDLGHPFTQALVLDYAALLHQWRGEVSGTLALANTAMTLGTEQGFAYYLAWATILQGWALTAQHQEATGIAQMRQGLAALQATGGEARLPYYLALLAEAHARAGQADEGLIAVSDALAHLNATGEVWYEAELHRLRGALLVQQATGRERTLLSEAEACLHRALSIAHRQHAQILALRAAMSLSRLWQSQGKRTEARELLAPIYDWFTEGFDTADLQEAKALLEELGE
jgi:DNA-binding winged helix-turn-helix (wHTH) protein/predicted ATPase